MTDAPGFAGVERRWGPEIVRVVLAEEASLLRRRLLLALEAHPRIEVVAEAVDLETLAEAVASHRPAVAVIDGRLPPDGAGTAVDAVLIAHPAARVVVITDANVTPFATVGSGVVEVAREDATGRIGGLVVALADGEGPDHRSG